jgi:hypothetical protein
MMYEEEFTAAQMALQPLVNLVTAPPLVRLNSRGKYEVLRGREGVMMIKVLVYFGLFDLTSLHHVPVIREIDPEELLARPFLLKKTENQIDYADACDADDEVFDDDEDEGPSQGELPENMKRAIDEAVVQEKLAPDGSGSSTTGEE